MIPGTWYTSRGQSGGGLLHGCWMPCCLCCDMILLCCDDAGSDTAVMPSYLLRCRDSAVIPCCCDAVIPRYCCDTAAVMLPVIERSRIFPAAHMQRWGGLERGHAVVPRLSRLCQNNSSPPPTLQQSTYEVSPSSRTPTRAVLGCQGLESYYCYCHEPSNWVTQDEGTGFAASRARAMACVPPSSVCGHVGHIIPQADYLGWVHLQPQNLQRNDAAKQSNGTISLTSAVDTPSALMLARGDGSVDVVVVVEHDDATWGTAPATVPNERYSSPSKTC